jgi:ferredoxin
MPVIHHGDRHLNVEDGETALDALLRGGVVVPNSCRAGACQSCRLRACAGKPRPRPPRSASRRPSASAATSWPACAAPTRT